MNLIQKLALDAGPILRALTRSRAGAVLIALQCAITLAIITNAIFIIQDRLKKMARPSGVDVENVFSMNVIPFAPNFDSKASIEADLRALRTMPGVVDAAVVNSFPLLESGGSSMYAARPGAKAEEFIGAARYEVDAHALNTLGLKLIAGRDFREDEIRGREINSQYENPVVILSKAFAEKMFPPDGNAVGKTLYDGNQLPIPIVGIVERAQAPWIGWGQLEYSAFFSNYRFSFTRYIVRAAPGERDRLMPQVEKMLTDSNSGRIINSMRSQTEIEARTYGEYRAMAIILVSVIVLIVIITGLGIVGLASFNVNARKKQIGTRRALGAQKSDIVRYFLVESWLITTVGAVIGAGLSFGLSYWMVNTFDLPPLDWRYIPVGVGFLWVLGLVAVLVPARRASQLAPALATRSV
ncbi:MAG: FtsX-like permease family protein [Pseudomonadota bacterium]